MKIFKDGLLSGKLSYKIGASIILSVFIVLVASGIFYIAKFTGEASHKFDEQLAAPAKLMSMGKLRYDAAADVKTMSNLVGGNVVNSVIIGKNKIIYYSNDSSIINKNVAEIELFKKYNDFNNAISKPTYYKEGDGSRAVCISTMVLT
jgi:hypothetical protein